MKTEAMTDEQMIDLVAGTMVRQLVRNSTELRMADAISRSSKEDPIFWLKHWKQLYPLYARQMIEMAGAVLSELEKAGALK